MENHSDISKNFIPYELALKLKELGFDEPCFGFYVPLLDGTQEFELMKFESQGKKVVLAPLWRQAFRFFREKYMLSGEIYIFKNIWNFDIEDISNSIQLYTSDIICYNSYEEAEVECLVKLIEIVKEQNVK